MSQPKKRARRKGAGKVTKTPANTTTAEKVTVDRLILSVRQQKQHIALLKAAAEYVDETFIPDPLAKKPKALLEDKNGHVEPADLVVVVALTTELRAHAEVLLGQLIALLDKNLDAIELDEVPVIETQEEPLADQPGMPPLPTIRRDHEEEHPPDEHHGDRL